MDLCKTDRGGVRAIRIFQTVENCPRFNVSFGQGISKTYPREIARHQFYRSLVFSDAFIEHRFEPKTEREEIARDEVGRLEFDDSLHMDNRLVVSPGENKQQSHIKTDCERKRIHF